MYKVNEIFYSLQGEGAFTGTPMVFVRFSGCNRDCSFCDTDFTMFRMMTVDDIVKEVGSFGALRVVLTGGEPLMQADTRLIEALHGSGLKVHLETNGSLPVPQGIDWVTCSPKKRPWNIVPESVNELKMVFTGQSDEELRRLRVDFPAASAYYLQPCSGANIPETVATVLRNPEWRLSLQTHKLIDIK